MKGKTMEEKQCPNPACDGILEKQFHDVHIYWCPDCGTLATFNGPANSMDYQIPELSADE